MVFDSLFACFLKKYTEKSGLFIFVVQALDQFEPRYRVNSLPVWNCHCKHCVFASPNALCFCWLFFPLSVFVTCKTTRSVFIKCTLLSPQTADR